MHAKNSVLNFTWIVKLILVFTVIRPRARRLWSRVSTPSNATDFIVFLPRYGPCVLCSRLSTGYRILFFSSVTRPGREVHLSPMSNVGVMNIWSYTFVVPTSSMRSAQ
jgi:hypothetical protein